MAGSGYQQDSNQITPGMYRVVLTMTNTSNYPVASATTTQNGTVNPYDWDNSSYSNASSMTATQATYMAQGNLRWQRILDNLTSVADGRIENVVVSGNTNGTDATTQPTGVSFTVSYDRDSFILGEWNAYLKSQGKSSSGTYTNADGVAGQTAYLGIGGTAVTTVPLAIQDIVTEAILTGGSTGWSRQWRVYNPTQLGDSQVKVTIQAPNSTAATIFSTVAVSQISGTTLAGTPQ
jgi:hypothetical protein